MAMTLKRKEAIVKKAIKNFSAALESLDEIDNMALEFGTKKRPDNSFRISLNHLMAYWETAEWWKKQPEDK